jgi:ABC1 atypical kinase-like domain
VRQQVYKAVLRDTGEEVAIKVQRPNVEPLIFRDLYIFRQLARFVTPFAMKKLGCNAELIVDEFGEKLLEELDYAQEARNIQVSYFGVILSTVTRPPLLAVCNWRGSPEGTAGWLLSPLHRALPGVCECRTSWRTLRTTPR